jgi:hypothetical protein
MMLMSEYCPCPVEIERLRRERQADDRLTLILVRLLAVALEHDREVFDSVLRDLRVRSSRRLDLEVAIRGLIKERK